MKSWLIGKDSDAGRDWGQKKGMTENEMAGWHHRLNGCESEWTPGVGDGQGGLGCCDSWSCKELDTTEWLTWTDYISKNELQKCREVRTNVDWKSIYISTILWNLIKYPSSFLLWRVQLSLLEFNSVPKFMHFVKTSEWPSALIPTVSPLVQTKELKVHLINISGILCTILRIAH